MCAQKRLRGLFTALAEDEENTATTLGFLEGEIVSATIGAQAGVDAAYSFLTWEKGSFKFSPGDAGSGEPLAQSVEHLLLAGGRLLDESQKHAGGAGALAWLVPDHRAGQSSDGDSSVADPSREDGAGLPILPHAPEKRERLKQWILRSQSLI